MQGAIAQAQAAGLLGGDILGRGLRFDIEIRRGAGAYICGEETALFESIEGKRGEPRNKPPFPVSHGLFGKPTVANNVETFANIPSIVLDGGAAFAQDRHRAVHRHAPVLPERHGARARRLRGAIRHELAELVALAGGVPDGHTLRAVLLGGAAGGFVRAGRTRSQAHARRHARRGHDARLGRGDAVRRHGRTSRDVVLRIAAFFRDESCGQCVPCRVGTVRQEEALHRIASGKTLGGVRGELALLEEIGVAMKDGSICGLGQTAYSAVESAIKRLGLYAGAGSATA